jgi:hypothetical protein
MKGRSLLALSVLSLALACEGNQSPTGLGAPRDPSKFLQDGAHNNGNKDFFFLPPMVPLPLHNPDFHLGKFNNALRPSLRVDICELDGLHLNALNVPTDLTKCIAGNPMKRFAAGTVQLVNLPLRQTGWWTLFGLPADGFYYVLWDTRQSNLNVSKFYRISVFVEGRSDALGIADVDPMSSLREWKYSLTGDVIQLVDDVMLPITFRVQQGALCEPGTTCASATYTNTAPLELKFDPDGTGSVAGVLIPDAALPTPANTPSCTPANPCPTSVVVNITKVNTGPGIEGSTICHPDIPFLQQFKGCYNFSTTPALRRLNESGDQFVKDLKVAVCYELEGTGDPREKFAELYSSSTEEEPSKWLDDIPEGTLIGGLTKDCTPPIIGSRSSNPLIQFASSGWRTLKGGLAQVFGVKTAYAIDLGLGGLTKGFSHISPVLRAQIQPASFTDVTLARGQLSTNVSAKIVAQHFHADIAPPGINSVPVTFTVGASNGTIKLVTDAGPGATGSITVNTSTLPAGVAINGISSVTWIPPTAPGTYTMTARGAAYGGQIVYSATVPPPYEPWSGTASIPTSGTPVVFGGSGFCDYSVEFTNIQGSLDLNTTGGGSAAVAATQTERIVGSCPFAPAPVHLDHYTSTNVTRTGNSVTVTLVPVGNPISATLTFVGTMSADQQSVSGTFTWHRYDQPLAPVLNWTVVVAGTFTRTPPPGVGLTPQLVFTGSEFYTAGGSNWVRYKLGVTNWAAYPPEMFAPAPTLPPCGLNTNSSRTWVDIYDASNNSRMYGFCGLGTPSDLNLIWFAKPVGVFPPSQVYIRVIDRATNTTYQSNNVTPVYPP